MISPPLHETDRNIHREHGDKCRAALLRNISRLPLHETDTRRPPHALNAVLALAVWSVFAVFLWGLSKAMGL